MYVQFTFQAGIGARYRGWPTDAHLFHTTNVRSPSAPRRCRGGGEGGVLTYLLCFESIPNGHHHALVRILPTSLIARLSRSCVFLFDSGITGLRPVCLIGPALRIEYLEASPHRRLLRIFYALAGLLKGVPLLFIRKSSG